MEAITISSDLSWDDGRVFVDFAVDGCGSGCAYCYIASPSGAPSYIGEDRLEDQIDELVSHPAFIPGRMGTLISLSPETEPLKLGTATRYTRRILERILPLGNPVQLPTKEGIPEKFALDIDELIRFKGQLVVFLSMATVSRAQAIEPRAGSVQKRLENVGLLRGTNWTSCAYIKPFLRTAPKELLDFAKVLNAADPDYICVGMRYQAQRKLLTQVLRAGATPEKSLPLSGVAHPVEPNHFSSGISPELTDFTVALRDMCSPIPVFLTSTCVSAHAADREPPQQIWRNLPALCIRCRACGEVGG